jgi:hypothetical protein
MRTKEDKEDRDREIENITGNLMIAQYQVEKLHSTLSAKIGGYYRIHNTKTSAFAFKSNDNSEKWYKVSINVDEMDSEDIEIISD